MKFQDMPHAWEGAKWEILSDMQKTYNLKFSDDEINGLKYTHGEGGDHRKDTRTAPPLAAHVHHCDKPVHAYGLMMGRGYLWDYLGGLSA